MHDAPGPTSSSLCPPLPMELTTSPLANQVWPGREPDSDERPNRVMKAYRESDERSTGVVRQIFQVRKRIRLRKVVDSALL